MLLYKLLSSSILGYLIYPSTEICSSTIFALAPYFLLSSGPPIPSPPGTLCDLDIHLPVHEEFIAVLASELWQGVQASLLLSHIQTLISTPPVDKGVMTFWKFGDNSKGLHGWGGENLKTEFFLIYFFIEGLLLYRILLFSVKPQHESAIGIHISLPFWNSLPSPSLSHPSRLIQGPCLSFLSHTANSHWLSILHMVI